MTNPHGIIIFGPNGSGKTTLGRQLACILNFHAMDIEDYYFEKSDIPYTVKRSREECLALMLADIQKHGAFVLSAVTGDFGGEIESLYDLAVWIDAPARLRLQRVKQRSFDQYGERILEGGDMHENHLRFMDFVATRSLSHIERWAESLCCPIVRIDGALDYKQTAADIEKRIYTKPDEPWLNLQSAKDKPLNIRTATSADAGALHDLYMNHLTANPPQESQDMAVWREKLTLFESNPFYHLLVGEIDGRVVSSATLIIIENLTHNVRPYAIIENVVTHADYRGKHYATDIMNRASEIAGEFGCYKIMLLTGSKDVSTLRFYENCGFNRNDKTAFIKWI